MGYKLLLFLFLAGFGANAQSKGDLRIILIRHGEKPADGDHLSCAGYNRAVRLPEVLVKKFGVPGAVFVPSVTNDKAAKSLRMMETAFPLSVKYNLALNSKFDVDHQSALAGALLKRTGLVLVIWEHKALTGIIKQLGVSQAPGWKNDDFDSIWIVTVHNGKTTLSKDRENISPAAGCSF